MVSSTASVVMVKARAIPDRRASSSGQKFLKSALVVVPLRVQIGNDLGPRDSRKFDELDRELDRVVLRRIQAVRGWAHVPGACAWACGV